MSESEKRLREALEDLRVATRTSDRTAFHGMGAQALDELLAEHRAEVEALNADVHQEQQQRLLAEAKWNECAAAASQAEARLSAARNAALEEAALYVDSQRAAGPVDLRRMRDALRALQSAPALLDAAKVREVLARRVEYATAEGHGWVSAELRAVAEDLGLPLDAEGAKRKRTPSAANHWLNDVQECSPSCPACQENVAAGLNPDGTDPDAEGAGETALDEDGEPVTRWARWPALYGDGTPCRFCTEGNPCATHEGMPEFPRYDRFLFSGPWKPREPSSAEVCLVCGVPKGQPHKMSCRPQNRRDAEAKATGGVCECGWSRGMHERWGPPGCPGFRPRVSGGSR